MNSSALTKATLGAAGLVAGFVLASTVGAQAATTTPSPSSSSSAAATNPGDDGADGVPEDQEQHGGRGRGGHLALSGSVTAVGADSVTIKTATAATRYVVTSTSDIDKNGEATLGDLAVGDAVTFGVEKSNATQIDRLHAGDEAKDVRAAPGSTTGATGTPSAGA